MIGFNLELIEAGGVEADRILAREQCRDPGLRAMALCIEAQSRALGLAVARLDDLVEAAGHQRTFVRGKPAPGGSPLPDRRDGP